jgi:hypothetical protein
MLTLCKEVRLIILPLLLLRSATIAPGWAQYLYETWFDISGGGHNSRLRCDQEMARTYKYQYSEYRQKCQRDDDDDDGGQIMLPEYSHLRDPVDLTILAATEPIITQAKLIADGAVSLPFTYKLEEGTQIGCDVIQQGELGSQFPQVLNRIKLSVEPLKVLALLRVCKQLLAEGRGVLYGENTSAFIAFLRQHRFHYHKKDDLKHAPHLIPGLPQKDGSPNNLENFEVALALLFRSASGRPKFVATNTMLLFFNQICRINAMCLT